MVFAGHILLGYLVLGTVSFAFGGGVPIKAEPEARIRLWLPGSLFGSDLRKHQQGREGVRREKEGKMVQDAVRLAEKQCRTHLRALGYLSTYYLLSPLTALIE